MMAISETVVFSSASRDAAAIDAIPSLCWTPSSSIFSLSSSSFNDFDSSLKTFTPSFVLSILSLTSSSSSFAATTSAWMSPRVFCSETFAVSVSMYAASSALRPCRSDVASSSFVLRSLVDSSDALRRSISASAFLSSSCQLAASCSLAMMAPSRCSSASRCSEWADSRDCLRVMSSIVRSSTDFSTSFEMDTASSAFLAATSFSEMRSE
ncbi:translation initiation factor 3B1 [Striga asiatica]|uniref:Translation initiation factor 3B1 n=1 Tax=Striga asiatica TaxID=4170 RepID=A0A5A7PC20_STRAF|nr:translation initiation factor 3B1 [Striga asiatica]